MIKLTADISEQDWMKLHTSFPELRSQIVIIKHQEFPNGLWYLRLPEQITDDKDAEIGPYQVGMHWVTTEKGWKFDNCPIVGMNGMVCGGISVKDSDTIDFSLTVENQSKEAWKRALAWLCFNHSHAKEYYQYRNFVCCNSEIVTTPAKVMEHYCIKGQHRGWWTKGDANPTECMIGTCCRTEQQQNFCVAIGADNAIMLGQNPSWPCTDIALFFGDVRPGDSSTARGRIYFRKADPVPVMKEFREDFG